MFKRYQQIHFVGIGGAGMSGIAEILLNLGYRVTGSDQRRNEAVERLEALGAKIFIGHEDYLVAEADESDGSFLKLAPTLAVVTTVDAEHLDHYGTLEAIREAFVRFVNKVPFYGSAVLCLDQPNIQMLIPRIEKRIITYGLESSADLVARRLSLSGMTSRFEVYQRGGLLGECTLQIPGRHNVLNALAAIGVALDIEIPFVTVERALAGFAGVQRRFQIRGRAAGVTVVDDYGHHPAEIRATLAAAKAGFDCRVVTVFQPHRYTRTRDLRQEFLTAFNQADVLIVMDIYPAGETPIPGVTAEDLAERIRANGPRDVTFLGSDRARIVEYVTEIIRPGDLVITLGAGDVGLLGPELLKRLEPDALNGRAQC